MTGIPYLGKRYGGNLAGSGAGTQAGNYGDTLWIPLHTFNDSGGSININTGTTTLTKTDIEVFKNGEVTPRATDSGYFIGDTGTSYVLGTTQAQGADTGQYADRAGLRRIGIRIMNTADDASFYEVGATYHVALDNFTITGQSGHTQTVRAFVAWFEIGDSGAGLGTGSPVKDTTSVNIKEVDFDTGPAGHLATHFRDTGGTRPLDTGYFATAQKDTGAIANAVWAALKASHADTGSFGEELGQGINVERIAGDTGVVGHVAMAFTDSGGSVRSNLHEIATDTGLRDNFARGIQDSGGSVRANLFEVRSDTGPAANLAQSLLDTGVITANMHKVFTDTGAAANLQQAVLDTGVILANINKVKGDTGVAANLAQGWLDTGFGLVDIRRVWGDSGAASRIDRAGRTEVLGTCAALGTTTSVIASAISPASAVNDQFVGRIMIFDKDTTTAALRGQATDISAYTHATLTFTVTALTTAPASGDTFVIV